MKANFSQVHLTHSKTLQFGTEIRFAVSKQIKGAIKVPIIFKVLVFGSCKQIGWNLPNDLKWKTGGF